MRCVKCQSENVRIIDSRLSDGNTIKRRRWCEDCGNKFTTIEIQMDTYNALKIKGTRLDWILKLIKEATNVN